MVQQTRRVVQPQGLPVQAPHTLPFLGELLWPTLNKRILQDLCYWQVPTDQMGPDFPMGTVIALKRITSRQQLTLGRVYLFEYTVCAGSPAEQRQQRMGRLVKLAYGRMWLTQDESTEAGCWLAWQDADFALYEVTHYVTLGTGSHPIQKTRRCGVRTHVQTAQYEAHLFSGVGVRLQVTDGKRRVYRAWVALPTVQAVAKLVCRQQGITPLPFVTAEEGGQAA